MVNGVVARGFLAAGSPRQTRSAGVGPDERLAEAIDLVERKRDSDGRWPLDNPHAGNVHFDMEDGAGQPSRWNTLRGLRVLDWYRAR
jgi:hypothetical protein